MSGNIFGNFSVWDIPCLVVCCINSVAMWTHSVHCRSFCVLCFQAHAPSSALVNHHWFGLFWPPLLMCWTATMTYHNRHSCCHARRFLWDVMHATIPLLCQFSFFKQSQHKGRFFLLWTWYYAWYYRSKLYRWPCHVAGKKHFFIGFNAVTRHVSYILGHKIVLISNVTLLKLSSACGHLVTWQNPDSSQQRYPNLFQDINCAR